MRASDIRIKTQLTAFAVLTPPNPDYHQLVSCISVPILLLIADKGVVSLERARELQILNLRLRSEQIPHAGHGVPYDQPDHFAAAVSSFLKSLVA